MKLLPLTRGFVAKVDDDIFEALLKFGRRWQAAKRRNTWYASASGQVYLHRWVMNLSKGDPRWIDHDDGDGLNNQRSNLLLTSPRDNGLHRVNAGPTSATGYRGVSSSSVQHFRAYVVGEDGRQKSIGVWPTSLLAASGRDYYVLEHASRSILNFPEGPPYSLDEVKVSKLELPEPKSGYPMIRFSRNQWEACIRISGKRKYLGLFPTLEEALLAQSSAKSTF